MTVLFEALKGFPSYIFGWVVGLIAAILSDLHITTLAVTAVAVGAVAHSVLIGVAAFFVLYSLSRIAALVSDAIGFGAQVVSIELSGAADKLLRGSDPDFDTHS